MTAMILIVDDDPDILDLISALLNEEGFQTVTCSDGLAALRSINANRPALAIIDLAMPVMTGAELIEYLRKAPGQPLPIIAMSSALYAPPPGQLQIDAYLAKPFDLEELLAHVKHLTHRESEPEAEATQELPSLATIKQRLPRVH